MAIVVIVILVILSLIGVGMWALSASRRACQSAAAGLAEHRRLKRQLMREAGMCPDCGYSVRAETDRCPECGASL